MYFETLEEEKDLKTSRKMGKYERIVNVYVSYINLNLKGKNSSMISYSQRRKNP